MSAKPHANPPCTIYVANISEEPDDMGRHLILGYNCDQGRALFFQAAIMDPDGFRLNTCYVFAGDRHHNGETPVFTLLPFEVTLPPHDVANDYYLACANLFRDTAGEITDQKDVPYDELVHDLKMRHVARRDMQPLRMQ